jgi:CxxC-x17-CxxC domain-containing protein
MPYTDQTLICRDCGESFAFTAGEQDFYAARGLMNAPTRCPDCRAARKASGSYGGGSSGRPSREMHEARYDSCGGVARVPFVPRGDKPVYCSDCFNRSRAN